MGNGVAGTACAMRLARHGIRPLLIGPGLPVDRRMRREAPVCFVPSVGLRFVTRWVDVEFAASNPQLIDSARARRRRSTATMGGESILVLDGEPQRKLRAMLDRVASPARGRGEHARA